MRTHTSYSYNPLGILPVHSLTHSFILPPYPCYVLSVSVRLVCAVRLICAVRLLCVVCVCVCVCRSSRSSYACCSSRSSYAYACRMLCAVRLCSSCPFCSSCLCCSSCSYYPLGSLPPPTFPIPLIQFLKPAHITT